MEARPSPRRLPRSAQLPQIRRRDKGEAHTCTHTSEGGCRTLVARHRHACARRQRLTGAPSRERGATGRQGECCPCARSSSVPQDTEDGTRVGGGKRVGLKRSRSTRTWDCVGAPSAAAVQFEEMHRHTHTHTHAGGTPTPHQSHVRSVQGGRAAAQSPTIEAVLAQRCVCEHSAPSTPASRAHTRTHSCQHAASPPLPANTPPQPRARHIRSQTSRCAHTRITRTPAARICHGLGGGAQRPCAPPPPPRRAFRVFMP